MNNRTLILALGFLLVCYVAALTQSPNRITQRCPNSAPTQSATVGISAQGAVSTSPCPNQDATISGTNATNILSPLTRVYDQNYLTPTFSPALSRFTLGSLNYQSVPAASNFIGLDNYNRITLANTTSKTFMGSRDDLTLNGTPTGNSSIIGKLVNLASASTWNPSGSLSAVYGFWSNVDIAAQGGATEITGGRFRAIVGSVNVGNVTTLAGVRAFANYGYAATITDVIGVSASTQSASDFGGTATNIKLFHATKAITQSNATNLFGLYVGNYNNTGTGTIMNSYGVYIDNTLDASGTNKYPIFSQSTAPSVFSGDVYVNDSTKGIILRSPDNTCYRFTVANGGTLNAGAAVTCP